MVILAVEITIVVAAFLVVAATVGATAYVSIRTGGGDVGPVEDEADSAAMLGDAEMGRFRMLCWDDEPPLRKRTPQ